MKDLFISNLVAIGNKLHCYAINKQNELKGIRSSLYVVTNRAEAQGRSGFVP